jgi:sugar phosphate permease
VSSGGRGNPYRWAILAVGVLAQASFSALFFGIPVLAPALRAEYRLSLAELGVVLASVNVGMLLTVLPWGVLADRVGERFVIATGLTVAATSLVIATRADRFPTLAVALAAAGAFGACVQAASGRAVMAWFGAGERGFALGIRQTAVVVGGALAALVLPATTDAGGVRAGVLVLAGGALAAALASAAFLRDPGRPSAAPAPLRLALRDDRLWRLCFGSTLLVVAQVGVLGFTVLFLHDERGFSTGEAGAVLAVMQVLGGVFRIGSGRWSDRVGTRIAPLLRLGFALTVALAVSAALVDAPSPILLPALVAAGSLSASWNALSFTAAAEFAGEARAGAALGLQQASLALGAAITPVVFAALVAVTSWTVAFGFAGIAALAGTLSLLGLAAREAEIA